MLDPEAFRQWLLEFMGRFAEGIEGVVPLDGKTLRRSYDRAAGQSPLHLVSVWAEARRLALGQVAVDDKSNEITAVPPLLEMPNLTGKAVTADAMHCQRQLAQQVVEPGGDYALALKGNQGKLQDDVKLFLDDSGTQVAQVGKGHGRVESRIANVSADVDWLQERHDWPGLQAVGKVTATRRKDGKASEETRYYPLSQAWPPERSNEIAGGHWGIENRLHWYWT